MNCFASRNVVGAVLFFIKTLLYAGMPLWSIAALTPTKITVPQNSFFLIKYQITNNSHKPHTLVMRPIPGLTQITGGTGVCGTHFTLPERGFSCVLSLLVNGSQLKHPISDGPVICQENTPLCYRPDVLDLLHIIPGPPLTQASIAVSGSPLILTAGGAAGTLTIHNNSLEVTATNVVSHFSGTALQGNVTESDNTCAAIAPNSSCTLTYTAGNTPVSQTTFTISGSNTNMVSADITITIPSPGLSLINPNAGTSLGSTTVTLTGTNLINASAVTFDGLNAANVTVINSTTVTADTPAHPAGLVDVTITTPGGSFTLANGYTYQLLPTLTSITPTSGTALGNTGVILSGTNLAGATSVTFDGVAATFVNVISGNTVTAVTPAHLAGAVDVVITTPDGSATLTDGYTYAATAIAQASGGGLIGCLGGGLNDFIVASANNGTVNWWPFFNAPAVNVFDNDNGAANTAIIVGAYGTGTNYAAGLCNAYEIDSAGNAPCQPGYACYDDWFLPAVNQLLCVYQNRGTIGGFPNAIYWASVENINDPANSALGVNFTQGAVPNPLKFNALSVRCIRSFTP